MYLQQYQQNINIELDEKELWTKFYGLTNEMILTKAGRRTFPLIKIRMAGLEETSLYTVQVEFRVSDTYKYRFVNGEWRTSQRTEKLSSSPILYEHTDSPNFGHHWVKDSIAFGKLKLTNNENSKSADAVYLRSLNKYDPVIHIYKHDKKNVDDKMLVFSHFFKETQFIAVTAYQNEQITSLKIKFNPFAKAFLNNNKPLITIENSVVSAQHIKKESSESKPAAKTQFTVASISQPNNVQPTLKSESEITFSNQNQQLQQSNPRSYYPNTFPTNTVGYGQSNDFINNWYASRYPIDTHRQPSYRPSPHQPQSQTYTNMNTQAPSSESVYSYQNMYGFDYASSQQHLNNQYLYQQRFYQNQFPYYQQQSQSDQQHQLTGYQYPPIELNYSTGGLDCTAYSTSPTNDYYPKANNTSSAKRPALKDNRHAPYMTSRPSARRASNQNSSGNTSLNDNLRIPISPVYNSSEHVNHTNVSNNTQSYNNTINSKLEFNDNNSDDSINSTEMFLNQLNNRNSATNTQSSISSVSSNYSTVSNKFTNESGYYSHSPTSIAHILDSASALNNHQESSD